MLRVSKIIDYGTLVLTHMAAYPERLFSAADLAVTLGLGQPVVSKVLKALGRHNLVKSSRGARGGYALGRPPQQISIAQIVDALEEQPFGLTECSATPGACSFEAGCHVRTNWQHINAIVRRTLEDTSLADMVRPVPIGFPVRAQPSELKPQSNVAASATTWSFRK
jgi:FeS assembly SUF system regulator